MKDPLKKLERDLIELENTYRGILSDPLCGCEDFAEEREKKRMKIMRKLLSLRKEMREGLALRKEPVFVEGGEDLIEMMRRKVG